jgi:hypothetical protein
MEDYIDDFDLGSVNASSVRVSSPSYGMSTIEDRDEGIIDLMDSPPGSPAKRRAFPRRKMSPGASTSADSPSKMRSMLRVGTPGVAMSRSGSTRGKDDDEVEESPLVKPLGHNPRRRRSSGASSNASAMAEERDDVDHTLVFKLQSHSTNSGAVSFTVKTFREIRSGTCRHGRRRAGVRGESVSHC